jgi:2-polyprenyl-6-methoxyphenol hydroxylase-like FAD-dependent oxidoreductase
MSQDRPVALIIGGGIGGLATAIALSRIGWAARVFEQAGELTEIGAGLTMWCNGVKALARLGVAKKVLEAGSVLERFEVRTHDGRSLGDCPFAEMAARHHAPSVCVHRADLLAALAEAAAASAALRLSARCASFAADDSGVTAHFADGSEARGDLLVGADGLHSLVRSRLHGDSPPRYAGYTCWRGLAAPFSHAAIPPGSGFEAWGPGRRFAVLPCGRDRVFWYATLNAPPGGSDAPAGRKAEVAGLYARWLEPVEAVIQATAADAILRNDIVDRRPVATWGTGRVTLLGDAAHPTTPNFGQGACMALEDALVLADCLWESRDVGIALRWYEARRVERTSTIVRQSRRIGWVAQWQNPLAVWVRTLAGASGLTRGSTLAQVESMLAEEPPSLPPC